MNDIFTKVITWIKANLIIAVIGAFILIMLLFPKLLRGLFVKKRVKHRISKVKTVAPRRRRSLPRSVGMSKIRRRNKPAQYNKSVSHKKPWQIKGSVAARRHMAQIRRHK